MHQDLRQNKLSMILLPIILICIGIRSYSIAVQKEDLYIDEVYSFYTSNNNLIKKTDVYDALKNNKIEQYVKDLYASALTGVFSYDDFRDNCYIQSDGFNYFNAYFIQMADVHPPLYYLCLHTVCSITQSTDFILNGYIVNIVFLLLTCIFLYLVVIEVLNDNWLALIAVGFYGFSCEFSNIASYFRMYCVAAFWFILLLYQYVRLSKANWMFSKKTLLGICITQFLAMFTQYFSILYILPLFGYAMYKMRGNKQNRNLYLKYNITSAIIYVLLWPCIIFQLLIGSSSYGGFQLLPEVKKVLYYVKLLIESLFAGRYFICLLFFVFVISMIVYYNKRHGLKFKTLKDYLKNNQPMFLLVVPSIFYFIAVALISPWAAFRYQSPIMPALSIIVTLIAFFLLGGLVKKRICYLLLVGFTFLCSFSWGVPDVSCLYIESEEKKSFCNQYSSKEAILFDDNNLVIYLDIPLKFKHPAYIHTDNLHANTYLADKLISDEYVLYAGDGADVSEISDLLREKNYICEKIDYKLQFWEVYSLRRK